MDEIGICHYTYLMDVGVILKKIRVGSGVIAMLYVFIPN